MCSATPEGGRGSHMAFGGHEGIPFPGVCNLIGAGCLQGDIVGGSEGVVGRGAEVHLQL